MLACRLHPHGFHGQTPHAVPVIIPSRLVRLRRDRVARGNPYPPRVTNYRSVPQREQPGQEILKVSTAPPRYVIVVSRSRPDVFRTLQDNFREPVIWDQRGAERRTGQRRMGRFAATLPGRRHSGRRGSIPKTWETYGFVLTWDRKI